MRKEDKREATGERPRTDQEAMRSEQADRRMTCAAYLNAMKTRLNVGENPWQICREVTEEMNVKCC